MASDPLTEPILAYLKELVDDFRRSHLPVYLFEGTEWIKEADGGARRMTINRPHLGGFLHHYKTISPRYSVAIDAIRHDPDFSPAIESLVGDEGGLTRFDCDTVIGHAAEGIARADGTVTLRRSFVSRRLGELRRYLKASSPIDTMIIPLPGLKSYRFPFAIDDGIEIDVLSADEIGSSVGAGVLRPMSDDFPFLGADECVGMRIKVRSSRQIVTSEVLHATQDERIRHLNEETNKPHKFGAISRWKMGDCIDDLLFVLRLARPEFVGTLGAVLVSERPPGRSRTGVGRPTRNFVRTTYEIDRATGRAIRSYWRELKAQAGQRRSLPSICERRFNAAMDRVSLDDAIVDHLVAAEALFLKDAGSPQDRGELGYRLALRAASLLETRSVERLATLKFMKRAYDLRSGIAHGGTSPATVKVPGRGTEVPLHEFVDELSSVMRRALQKAIPLYQSDSTFGTTDYWDSLVIGS